MKFNRLSRGVYDSDPPGFTITLIQYYEVQEDRQDGLGRSEHVYRLDEAKALVRRWAKETPDEKPAP